MALALYIGMWVAAALASSAGLTAVWIPCIVVAGIVVIRLELLAALRAMAQVPPAPQLDDVPLG